MQNHKQNRKQRKEYTDQEKEWRFARWFWNRTDTSSWDSVKVFITLLISLTVAIMGYIIVSSIHTVPTAVFIGVGLLIGLAIFVNMDIRSAFFHLFRRGKYDQIKRIENYRNLIHYFLNGHEDVLFIENGRDLTAVGFFKLKAIPLAIHGNFERFIRALYQQQVPLYWHYGQTPIDEGAILGSPAVSEEAREFYEGQPPYEFESRMEAHGGMWAVRILLSTRRTIPARGNLGAKRIVLYQKLSADLFKIYTAFTSAYPHTILESLFGEELIKAHSIAITGGGIPAFF
ncbi:MAG: hypothetical protein ACFFD2_11035 [Promethearchaeota archaeon]